jgi:hypothetical protein
MKKNFKKIEANQKKRRRFEYLVQEEMSFKHSEIVETNFSGHFLDKKS